MQYLFPCAGCGQAHIIDTTQAGENIHCPCGLLLEVPALRSIRELAPVQDAVTSERIKRWGPGRGLAFVAGFLLVCSGAAISMIAAVYQARLVIPEPPVYDAAADGALVDALSPGRAWDEWLRMRRNGLGPFRPSGQYLAQQIRRRLRGAIYVGSAIAAVGLIVAVGACLFPGGRRAADAP